MKNEVARQSAPRLPLALLRALLSRAERDEISADVVEEYHARAAKQGRAAASRWLWRQALGSAPALLRWGWWREWTGFVPRANAYQAGGSMLRSWIADAQYAARRLRARPTYAALAALTLALGVGGTTAVYGIARGLLFDPLPFANEDEVGVFWKKQDWSEQEFLHVRGRVPGFAQVALYRPRAMRLREGDGPLRLVPGISSSAELFEVLGAAPTQGRGFQAGDDVEGAERVAVVSYGLWQELGASPDMVGAALTLDGIPHTVIGIMPRGFWFPDPTVRIWTPVPISADAETFNSTLVGRVEPGQDVRRVATPIAQLTALLVERFDYPPQWDKTVNPRITPVRDDMIGRMRPALLATLGAMALILLIACANVAALMLGQVHDRSAELAVRLAMGANRTRLTRQLFVEALLIAAAAGALGAGVAWGGYRLLARALPLGAWAEGAVPDWSLFAVALAIAASAAVLVVLVPAVSLWRGDLRVAMGTSRTGRLEGRGGRLESGLVVAEVALAVLVASGAALVAHSVVKLYALDTGVRAEGVGVLDVVIPTSGGLSGRRQTVEELTTALAGLPGVLSAGASQVLPLREGGYNVSLSIEGQPNPPGMSSEFRIVTPGYLETMGFELLDGRTITADDRDETERVVVINQAFVDKYFADVNPIGQRMADEETARVVGVVRNASERRLTDDAVPVRYVAVAQMPWVDEAQSFVLKAAPGADLVGLLDAARRRVQEVRPTAAVRSVSSMSSVLAGAVGPARQVVSLLSLLSGLALVLGAVGIYGATLHFAARRRRDWAIRVALGLSSAGAVTQVFNRGAALVAVGVGLGAVAAAALARLLSPLLYDVATLDPVAFVGAGSVLLAVGLLAAWVPARRAGDVDPATVLREQ
jgi:predicted permease